MVQLTGNRSGFRSAGRLVIQEPTASLTQRLPQTGQPQLVLRVDGSAQTTGRATRGSSYSQLLFWPGVYTLDVPRGVSELTAELREEGGVVATATLPLQDPQKLSGFHRTELFGPEGSPLGELSLVLETEGDVVLTGQPERSSFRSSSYNNSPYTTGSHTNGSYTNGSLGQSPIKQSPGASGNTSDGFSRGHGASRYRQGGRFETHLSGIASTRERGLGITQRGSPGGFSHGGFSRTSGTSPTNGFGSQGVRGASNEICQRQFFSQTEDRPVIIQRTEFIKIHRQYEKTFVTEVRFTGEREVGSGRAEVVGHEERVVDETLPGPVCEGVGKLQLAVQ